MIFAAAAAAIVATAPPNAAAAPATARTEQAGKPAAGKAKGPDFNPADIISMFDKIFPAQPDPAPGRLALSRTSVQGLFPDGTYTRLMDGLMSGMAERILGLSEADFSKSGKDGKPPSRLTLRDQMKKDDPHFEERMRITERVIMEEMAKLSLIIEPKMREGLARSMARRFNEKQLGDLNAFLATESGRAYGAQSMAMWVDSDVMRALMNSFPEIIAAMPGAMQRLETATAHLPKPPKPKAEKAADSEPDVEKQE